MKFRKAVQSWIALSPTGRYSEVSSSRKLVETILAIVLALAPAAPGMTVPWRWVCWSICWILFVGVILPDWSPLLKRFPLKTKYTTFTILMLVFGYMFYPVAHSQWRVEQAAVLAGYIRAPYLSATQPIIEFGDSGVEYPWASSDSQVTLLKDAGLKLELGNDGIEVSTVIRDRDDRLVVKLDKNHWSMSVPPASTDKNYTNDSFEVKDLGDHVVFQVRLLPDRAQIRGEWHDAFGGAVQLDACRDPQTGKVVGCIEIFGPNFPEKENRHTINPIFKYPSGDHWGEFVMPPAGGKSFIQDSKH